MTMSPRHNVETGRNGGALPEILAELDDLDPRILGVDIFQCGQRAVAAAVVDENDLVIFAPVLHGRGDLTVQDDDVLGFVEDRNDDGNQFLFHWLFLT